MKYLERYIKTLSDNVEVVCNTEKSSSKYFIIDGFDIRLSDHRSPIEGIAKPKQLDIIQAYKSDIFIVYFRDTNRPMLKDRKDLKTFIRNAYDMHCLMNEKHEGEKKWEKAKKKENVKKICDKVLTKNENVAFESPKRMEWKPERYKVESMIQKHTEALSRKLEANKAFTYVGCLKSFKKLRKESRTLFRELYESNDVFADDLLRSVADNDGSNEAENIVGCFRKYIKTENNE